MTSETGGRLWRTLYVSAVLGGGGALADVEAAVRRLAGIVRREEEADPPDDPASEAAVDATYHLPGPILRPDYEGLRTGRWAKAKRLLVVQVAVPEEISGDAEKVGGFLAESLVEAIDLAAAHLAQRKLPYSLDRARRVAERAAAALSAGRR
jgi:hypothetical protein